MGKKEGSYLVLNLAIFMSFMMVLIAIALEFCPSLNGEKDYLEGKQLVEAINFNDLQTATLLDGTKIKVTPSAEYPEDKIVEYKAVTFPVENHDGNAVVVATYSCVSRAKTDNDFWDLYILVLFGSCSAVVIIMANRNSEDY